MYFQKTKTPLLNNEYLKKGFFNNSEYLNRA